MVRSFSETQCTLVLQTWFGFVSQGSKRTSQCVFSAGFSGFKYTFRPVAAGFSTISNILLFYFSEHGFGLLSG